MTFAVVLLVVALVASLIDRTLWKHRAEDTAHDVNELADENDRLSAEVNRWRATRPQRAPMVVQVTARDVHIGPTTVNQMPPPFPPVAIHDRRTLEG